MLDHSESATLPDTSNSTNAIGVRLGIWVFAPLDIGVKQVRHWGSGFVGGHVGVRLGIWVFVLSDISCLVFEHYIMVIHSFEAQGK